MGYRLNCLDEPVFIAVSKPLLTEFGIHHRLESCADHVANRILLDITDLHLFDVLLGVLYGCETGPPAFNYWFPESEGFEL